MRQTTSPIDKEPTFTSEKFARNHFVIYISYSIFVAQRMCLPNCPFVIAANFRLHRDDSILLHFIKWQWQRHCVLKCNTKVNRLQQFVNFGTKNLTYFVVGNFRVISDNNQQFTVANKNGKCRNVISKMFVGMERLLRDH